MGRCPKVFIIPGAESVPGDAKSIANRAYRMFILNDFSSPKKKCTGTDDNMIEIDADEEIVMVDV